MDDASVSVDGDDNVVLDEDKSSVYNDRRAEILRALYAKLQHRAGNSLISLLNN